MPSKDIVQDEFDVLCGMKSLDTISSHLPQDLYSKFDDRDTRNWKKIQTWTDWWRAARILQKLSKVYTACLKMKIGISFLVPLTQLNQLTDKAFPMVQS